MDLFIDFLNWLLDGLAEGLTWIVKILPKSPFSDWGTAAPTEIELGYITWLIPFPTMILHFAGLVAVIGIYYLYRVAARWLKVVRG